MQILITNDDGIDAPGLCALYAAAQQFGEPIVVAPLEALSGCSHRVTTSQPLQVHRRDANHFVVNGTPADCVRVALHRLIHGEVWVLSGINAGGNLGADVYHSGTVAAVREAVLHGAPGIAASHYTKRGVPIDWRQATRWMSAILGDLLQLQQRRGEFWNVNLPHIESRDSTPEIVQCPLDPNPLPLSFREDGDQWHYDGNYHQRKRQAGSDVDVCFSGMIALTRIGLFD